MGFGKLQKYRYSFTLYDMVNAFCGISRSLRTTIYEFAKIKQWLWVTTQNVVTRILTAQLWNRITMHSACHNIDFATPTNSRCAKWRHYISIYNVTWVIPKYPARDEWVPAFGALVRTWHSGFTRVESRSNPNGKCSEVVCWSVGSKSNPVSASGRISTQPANAR